MSKSEKRKKRAAARAEFAAAVALAPSKKPKKTRGRRRMAEITTEREAAGASIETLNRRAALVGRTIRTETKSDGSPDHNAIAANNKHRAEMRHPAYGEDAGRALFLSNSKADANDLWAVFLDYTKARERYYRVCLGISPHAKCASIATEPDAMETRADEAPPDDRSLDERVRSASNRWMDWQGRLGCLGLADRAAFDDIAEMRRLAVADAKVTPRGRAFLVALKKIAERVK